MSPESPSLVDFPPEKGLPSPRGEEEDPARFSSLSCLSISPDLGFALSFSNFALAKRTAELPSFGVRSVPTSFVVSPEEVSLIDFDSGFTETEPIDQGGDVLFSLLNFALARSTIEQLEGGEVFVPNTDFSFLGDGTLGIDRTLCSIVEFSEASVKVAELSLLNAAYFPALSAVLPDFPITSLNVVRLLFDLLLDRPVSSSALAFSSASSFAFACLSCWNDIRFDVLEFLAS
mmetsp:Transcript_13218/g.33291  ORF Transcript_13218/g.33291 Transcript_13218/m.33291 type:complete len:232 (-) Transcript_13218:297-992(-)